MKDINEYMDNRQRRFVDGLGRINEDLYKSILDVLIEYSHGGVLKYSPELSMLEEKIRKILTEAGYGNAAAEFIDSTDTIDSMNIALYKRLDGLKEEILKSNRLKVAKDIITDNLRGAGVNDKVIKKLSNDIRTAVVNGATFKEARALMEKVIVEDGLLPRYVHQVTVDALGQYNGAIQADIIENHDPKGFYWVGEPIATSRPFSIHMEEKYGSRLITFKELEEDLREYCPGGIPSEDPITITTPIEGKIRTMKKGSGMIPGTTVKTFPIYRGGYESRYSVELVF